MQGSDAYDLETHVRATESAMKWRDKYATGQADIEVEGVPVELDMPGMLAEDGATDESVCIPKRRRVE